MVASMLSFEDGCGDEGMEERLRVFGCVRKPNEMKPKKKVKNFPNEHVPKCVTQAFIHVSVRRSDTVAPPPDRKGLGAM